MLKTISCILKFFATSYGKCPCDNKGGTVKGLWQLPVSNQILIKAEAMFKFCLQSINVIKFIYVTAGEMETKHKFADRVSIATTVV